MPTTNHWAALAKVAEVKASDDNPWISAWP